LSTSRKDSKGRVLKTGESERKDGLYQYRYTEPGGQRKTIYANNLNDFYKNVLRGGRYGLNTTSDVSMKSSAGLYNNFGSIEFAYSASSRGSNLGYFDKTIKAANGIKYSANNKRTVTGKELFVIKGIATGVRTLTLPEVNEANNLTFNGRNQLTETTGLYRLDKLTLKDSSGTNITPYIRKGIYFLASPSHSAATQGLLETYDGHINDYDAFYGGVRPVVSLKSGIQLMQETTKGETYYKIK